MSRQAIFRVAGAAVLAASMALCVLFLLLPGLIWDDYHSVRATLQGTVDDATGTGLSASRPRAVAALGLVAQEDRRLFSRTVFGHVLPLDVHACGRALVRNLTSLSIREGCSTLPMSLAKQAIPEDRRYKRSISGKLLQVRLSLSLMTRTPEEVVDGFLQVMPCGSDLAKGLDQCALLYFGRTPDDLHEAEALLVATAVQAPSRDLKDPNRARRRLGMAVNKLWEAGWLTRSEAIGVFQQPVRIGPLHADLVRAVQAGYDLALTQAAAAAVIAARGQAKRRAKSAEDLLVLAMVQDAQGRVLAWSGGGPYWQDAAFEAGSWVKSFCAQAMIEMPGVGVEYLLGVEVPSRVPLRDRRLRSWRPSDAGRTAPAYAVPAEYLVRSMNTGMLASLLSAHLLLSPAELDRRIGAVLSDKERKKYRSARDMAASLQLASAFAGMPLTLEEVPDLPGYRELSAAAVGTCLGTMKAHVPDLQVPQEDLAALLGVVRAPLVSLGAGMASLWLDDQGRPTELAGILAAWSADGTLSKVVAHVGTPLTYKTATAERNAGLMVLVPVDDAGTLGLLTLAAIRPSGADIHPVQGVHLSEGVEAFLSARGVVPAVAVR